MSFSGIRVSVACCLFRCEDDVLLSGRGPYSYCCRAVLMLRGCGTKRTSKTNDKMELYMLSHERFNLIGHLVCADL